MASYIGGASGAALGYITAGVPGAYYGYKYGRSAGEKFTNSNMAPISKRKSSMMHLPMYNPRTPKRRRATVVTTISGRVPRQKYAGKGKKLMFKKTKAKKKAVNKALNKKQKKLVKEIVERRIDGTKTTATYFKRWASYFRTPTQTSTYGTQEVTDNAPRVLGGSENPNDPMVKLVVGDFRKIIDAASVLFGSKAKNLTWTTTDNLAIQFAELENFYHEMVIELRNNSVVTKEIQFIEYTSKVPQDENATNPERDYMLWYWANIEFPQVGGGTFAGVGYLGNHPKYNGKLNASWNFSTKRCTIKPGEVCSYKLYVNKNIMDMRKMFLAPIGNQGSTTQYTFAKGFTKGLLIIHNNQAMCGISTDGVGYAATHNISQSTGFLGQEHMIAVDVKEKIIMSKPKNVDNTVETEGRYCFYSHSSNDLVNTSNVFNNVSFTPIEIDGQ